jgi:electron transport complex protein RnfB
MLKGDNSPRFWREAYRYSFLLYRGLLSAQSLSHKSALSPKVRVTCPLTREGDLWYLCHQEDTLNPFRALSAKLDYGHSPTLPVLLAMLVTPEEARWLLALPATPARLAARTDLSEAQASEVLHDLYMRGLVFVWKTTPDGPVYQVPGVGQLMDHILFDARYDALGEGFFDLWRDFYNNEFVHGQPQESDWGFRVVPVERAIAQASFVLPCEQVSELVRSARRIAVQSCPCRKRERRCDNPIDMCISLNELADYVLYRGLGRELAAAEALALLREAEERGLIHQVDNVDRARVICNCCPCCCVLLRSVVHHGLRSAIVKSRFRAQIDPLLCANCGACLERCHYGALASANGIVTVNPDECYGCGLCVAACPVEAIALVEVRQPAHIPRAESDRPAFVIPD